jgi:hypothetical protein
MDIKPRDLIRLKQSMIEGHEMGWDINIPHWNVIRRWIIQDRVIPVDPVYMNNVEAMAHCQDVCDFINDINGETVASWVARHNQESIHAPNTR